MTISIMVIVSAVRRVVADFVIFLQKNSRYTKDDLAYTLTYGFVGALPGGIVFGYHPNTIFVYVFVVFYLFVISSVVKIVYNKNKQAIVFYPLLLLPASTIIMYPQFLFIGNVFEGGNSYVGTPITIFAGIYLFPLGLLYVLKGLVKKQSKDLMVGVGIVICAFLVFGLGSVVEVNGFSMITDYFTVHAMGTSPTDSKEIWTPKAEPLSPKAGAGDIHQFRMEDFFDKEISEVSKKPQDFQKFTKNLVDKEEILQILESGKAQKNFVAQNLKISAQDQIMNKLGSAGCESMYYLNKATAAISSFFKGEGFVVPTDTKLDIFTINYKCHAAVETAFPSSRMQMDKVDAETVKKIQNLINKK